MRTVLLGLLVVVLTALESYVASRMRSYENLARKHRKRSLARRSAAWATGFEAILAIWFFLGMTDKWLIWCALPGAYIGQYLAITRTWRSREKKQGPPRAV